MHPSRRHLTASTLVLAALAWPAQAASYTWDSDGAAPLNDGTGSWNPSGGANWFDGSTFGAWGNTTADTAIIGAGNGAAGTLTVGTVTANGITFNAAGSGTYTLSGGSITLGGTAPTLNAGAAAAIGSVLTGTGGFTKTGAGNLTLTGENTLTGAIDVNAGTLTLADPVNNGTGTVRGTLNVNSGGTVVLATPNSLGWGAGTKVDTLNINGGTVSNTAAGDNGWGIAINFGANGGTLQSNGGVSSAATTQLFSLGGGSAVSTSGSATGTATIGGRVHLREGNTGNALTFTVNNGGAVVDLDVTAAITEAAAGRIVNKAGAGLMRVAGAGSWSGGTTISGGSVILGGGTGTLGSGGVTLAGGNLGFNPGSTGTTFTYANPVTVSNNATIANDDGITALTGAMSIGSGVTLTAATAGWSSKNLRLQGVISGAGAVNVQANGVTLDNWSTSNQGAVVMTAVNTYSGGTTVSSGTLSIQSGSFNAMHTTAPITVAAGATLTAAQTANNAHNIGPITLNGGTLTSVNGPGGVANDGGFGNWLLKGVTVGGTGLSTISPTTLAITSGSFTVADSVAGAGDDLLVSGSIIAGALTKTGPGSMRLTGANTFAGGTTVNQGAVILGAGTGTLGTGGVTLAGGHLGFNPGSTASTFTYANPVTVSSNATIANDDGVAALTGAVSIGSGVTLTAGTAGWSGKNLRLQGVISGAGALTVQANGLTLDNWTTSTDGVVVLTGENTFTGGTTVTSGTLALADPTNNATGTLRGTVNVNSGTILRLDTANSLGWGAGTKVDTLNINGGTVNNVAAGDNGWGIAINFGANAGTLQSNGGVSSGGATQLYTLGGGSSVSTSGSATGTALIAGRVNLRDSNPGNVVPFTVNNGSAANDLNVTATMTEQFASVGIVKNGLGTMTLTAENTFTGGVTVNAGTLALADPLNNGVGTVRGNVTVNTGATLRLDTANSLGFSGGTKVNTLTIDGGTVNNVASGDNGWGVAINFGANAGTLQSNGGVSSASTPQLFSLGGGSSVSTSAAATGTAVMAGRINLREANVSNNLTFTVNDGSAPVDLSVTAAITEQGGARGIVKAGAGTMALTGPTSHTGGTTVTGGTLQLLTGFNQLNFNGPVTVDAGAVLTANAAANNAHNVGLVALNGGTLTSINGVGGAANDGGFGNWLVRGVVVGGSTQSTISSTTLAVVSGSFNVGDSVAGAGTDLLVSSKVVSGAVSKIGAGTLVLADPANTHAGVTTVGGGTLLVNNGSEQTLGVNPGAFNAGQLALDGGTLQVSGSSLTIDDANRGVQVKSNSGTFHVDTGLTLSLANPLDGNFAGGTLTKNGAGTFSLTNNAFLNALRVAGGTYVQATGTTTIPSISTGLDIQSGGIYALNGGTLRTDRITIAAAGALNWGSARLTHANTIGDDGTVDFSVAGYHAVRSGTTLDVTGNLATGNGSVLALHASPTLYLNAGLRFNNVAVTGDLNLGGVNDVLELELNPYLLRPFSPNFGAAAQETGSLPLLTWTGTLTGAFDAITGVVNDGLGFTFNPGLVTDPTTLAANSYAFEYDLTDRTLWFHYRVSGYVPEPGSFGLLGLGVFLLRAVRGAGTNRRAARLGRR